MRLHMDEVLVFGCMGLRMREYEWICIRGVLCNRNMITHLSGHLGRKSVVSTL